MLILFFVFKTYIKNIKASYGVLATVELHYPPNTVTGKKLTEGWVKSQSPRTTVVGFPLGKMSKIDKSTEAESGVPVA